MMTELIYFSAYTNNTNNLDINGSFDDGTKVVLNTSDYD